MSVNPIPISPRNSPFSSHSSPVTKSMIFENVNFIKYYYGLQNLRFPQPISQVMSIRIPIPQASRIFDMVVLETRI